MVEKRQDTVRFMFRFPGDPEARQYDLAALRCVPDQDFPLAHRVTQDEMTPVLSAMPINLGSTTRALAERVSELQAIVETAPPVPLLLHCPMCHARHIDEGEFATKKHHTHACQAYVVVEGKRRHCGHVWRPAIVATVGVEALPGFINEMEPTGAALLGKRVKLVEEGERGSSLTGEIMGHDHGTYRVVGVGSSGNCRTRWLQRHEFMVLDP